MYAILIPSLSSRLCPFRACFNNVRRQGTEVIHVQPVVGVVVNGVYSLVLAITVRLMVALMLSSTNQ